jgi:hypothetical protein
LFPERWKTEKIRKVLGVYFCGVWSDSEAATRKQPSFLDFAYQCTAIDRSHATENDIAASQQVTRKSVAVSIGDFRYILVQNSVITKVLYSNDRGANRHIVFLMQLTTEWPSQDTIFRIAQVN